MAMSTTPALTRSAAMPRRKWRSQLCTRATLRLRARNGSARPRLYRTMSRMPSPSVLVAAERARIPASTGPMQGVQVIAKAAPSGADDHSRFELAEDLSSHHHHLVCGKCGKVADVHPSPRLERALAEAARAVADEDDFDVTDHRFDFIGVCADCR